MSNLNGATVRKDRQLALIDPQIAATWAEQLDAMADPIRLTILANLLTGPRCVSEIGDVLPLPERNISHHLRVLEQANLVVRRRGGMFDCYFLSRPVVVVSLFGLLLSHYDDGDAGRAIQADH